MKQTFIEAFDGAQIGLDIWDEVKDPKGIVQIAHGMAEHPDRYDAFAQVLNEAGYIVAASDHRGHRRGAVNGEQGLVYGDSWNQTLEDMKTLCDYLKATYNKEVVLFGHSYGSFLSQRFLELHASKLKGAILCGTAYMKSGLVNMGKNIAGLQRLFCGGDKKGKLIDKLSFGAYVKPFKSQNQRFAWLSRDVEEVAKYEADPDCGFVLCLDYYHSFFKGAMKMYGRDAKTIPTDFPILIIVGSEDPVSQRTKLADKLNRFYLKLGLTPIYKVYKDARHEILNDACREEVYGDVLSFLGNLEK